MACPYFFVVSYSTAGTPLDIYQTSIHLAVTFSKFIQNQEL